uniref:Uncharacterized protein n=1 Tax=Chromera velia CCMP2878 TaxID=1169474 RepID=A0A0G4HNG4_9ALVE|eukprot:Cvel_29444.t1-p1 / transcript=Cvel_29444.t1 / gene=Cvel_29444 / organism=Chromera_velia_CCMP2878 / gene_product=hypothetical protein / transcript_product=hypothetical protein / location=Cvel_scaffold4025:6876-8381(+) / protein_length=502 / sequence_SO=supercontig / SO=protein_coding / is_pseudo=false
MAVLMPRSRIVDRCAGLSLDPGQDWSSTRHSTLWKRGIHLPGDLEVKSVPNPFDLSAKGEGPSQKVETIEEEIARLHESPQVGEVNNLIDSLDVQRTQLESLAKDTVVVNFTSQADTMDFYSHHVRPILETFMVPESEELDFRNNFRAMERLRSAFLMVVNVADDVSMGVEELESLRREWPHDRETDLQFDHLRRLHATVLKYLLRAIRRPEHLTKGVMVAPVVPDPEDDYSLFEECLSQPLGAPLVRNPRMRTLLEGLVKQAYKAIAAVSVLTSHGYHARYDELRGNCLNDLDCDAPFHVAKYETMLCKWAIEDLERVKEDAVREMEDLENVGDPLSPGGRKPSNADEQSHRILQAAELWRNARALFMYAHSGGSRASGLAESLHSSPARLASEAVRTLGKLRERVQGNASLSRRLWRLQETTENEKRLVPWLKSRHLLESEEVPTSVMENTEETVKHPFRRKRENEAEPPPQEEKNQPFDPLAPTGMQDMPLPPSELFTW